MSGVSTTPIGPIFSLTFRGKPCRICAFKKSKMDNNMTRLEHWKEAVGKRILYKKLRDCDPAEGLVVEISPNGYNAKIRSVNQPTTEKWINMSEYDVIDFLTDSAKLANPKKQLLHG